MQLVSTEIAQDWIQLTYTDGRPTTDAGQVLIVRVPHQGPMKRPVMWHQMKALRAAQDLIEAECQRLRSELEKID